MFITCKLLCSGHDDSTPWTKLAKHINPHFNSGIRCRLKVPSGTSNHFTDVVFRSIQKFTTCWMLWTFHPEQRIPPPLITILISFLIALTKKKMFYFRCLELRLHLRLNSESSFVSICFRHSHADGSIVEDVLETWWHFNKNKKTGMSRHPKSHRNHPGRS